jgi:hypothetical protein
MRDGWAPDAPFVEKLPVVSPRCRSFLEAPDQAAKGLRIEAHDDWGACEEIEPEIEYTNTYYRTGYCHQLLDWSAEERATVAEVVEICGSMPVLARLLGGWLKDRRPAELRRQIVAKVTQMLQTARFKIFEGVFGRPVTGLWVALHMLVSVLPDAATDVLGYLSKVREPCCGEELAEVTLLGAPLEMDALCARMYTVGLLRRTRLFCHITSEGVIDSIAMWLSPTVAPVKAAERYYETGVWNQGSIAESSALSSDDEPVDLRLALREVVCEDCRMGQGLTRQLWAEILSSEHDVDDADDVWLRVAAADKEGGRLRKQSQLSDDGSADWRFRFSQLDVLGVLQRCVSMAAGVSGSLAEVRTAKALLLLVDEMAFDVIADPEARDADMVAPLPLQVIFVTYIAYTIYF